MKRLVLFVLLTAIALAGCSHMGARLSNDTHVVKRDAALCYDNKLGRVDTLGNTAESTLWLEKWSRQFYGPPPIPIVLESQQERLEKTDRFEDCHTERVTTVIPGGGETDFGPYAEVECNDSGDCTITKTDHP